MQLINALTLILVGSAIGSFIGATVWRIRAKDLVSTKANSIELQKIGFLNKSKLKNDRSHCLNCKHRLAWYDLIPIFSWLSLGGKCRYCKKPIGKFEIGIELITALYFLLSYSFWPTDISNTAETIKFLLWLVIGVCLLIISAYDAKWSEIPGLLMYATIALSLLWAIINVASSTNITSSIYSLVFSIAILSGFYLLIYLFSRGRWIGFGDVELGLALALLIGDWQLALVALFMSNFIGTVIVLPGLLSKKIKRTESMPFGPLFVAGFFIAYLWGKNIVNLFLQI